MTRRPVPAADPLGAVLDWLWAIGTACGIAGLGLVVEHDLNAVPAHGLAWSVRDAEAAGDS
ncbi:hypothetical protein ABCR94_13980 [Streptomyces sp. 21So2-11]|uniref:hypothetical protein n=1 Tax=Streptomyces sp. 21So2-11 TaxID=3144408 RepID=UPI00321B5DA6